MSCLELSDHVAATINRFVNRDRSSRKRARVGEPPTAAPASIEPTHDVEILSVWSLDLSGVGVDGISHNFFMVAHFLFSPLRLIILPLTRVESSADDASLVLRMCLRVDGTLDFRLIYHWVDQVSSTTPHSTHALRNFQFVPKSWDALSVVLDSAMPATDADACPTSALQALAHELESVVSESQRQFIWRVCL